MNIGVRAHDFGKTKLEDFNSFAKGISDKGFKCIQLALHKAVEGLKQEPGYINPGLANHIRQALDKNGVYIAVLGSYINPVHPDIKTRKKHIEIFKDHIRFARDFGTSLIGTETGSLNPDCSYNEATYTEEVFNDFIKSIAELVETAENFGVFVAIEAVANTNTIDSPERMKRVLDTIKSDNLQVIFDPVNMLDDRELDRQDDMIKKSFDLFGDRMAAFHIKDFIIENGRRKRVSAGKGNFNFELFFKLLKQTKPYASLLLEDSKPDTFSDAISYVKSVYERC